MTETKVEYGGSGPQAHNSLTPGTIPGDLAALGPARRGPTAEDEAYEIRIGRDGTWYYHGSPIGRIGLVKLFSTVLRKDEKGDYWLITPAERGRITVDDAPFVAVEVTSEGEGADRTLTFRTNLDQEVTAGPDCPIRVATDPVTREPSPYILVRDNLEARIARSVFYHLVEMGEARETDDGTVFGVWSKKTFFPLGPLSE